MKELKKKLKEDMKRFGSTYVTYIDDNNIDWEIATEDYNGNFNVWVRKDGVLYSDLRGSATDAKSAIELVLTFLQEVQ